MVNYRTPTNIRFPPDLHTKIKEISANTHKSFAHVVIDACYQYVEGAIPGICLSCHHQNDPDSRYCQKCGEPLTEEAEQKQKNLKKLMLNPTLIKELFDEANIDHVDEDNEIGVAINIIYQLQKQIDESKPILEWVKKKMEEEQL